MDNWSNYREKQTQQRHKILIDEEHVEDFPFGTLQPSQDCSFDEDLENFGLADEDDTPES